MSRNTQHLRKRIAGMESHLKPKAPALAHVVIIDGNEVIRPAGSVKSLVVPQILGLDEWEALASVSQDKLVQEARDEEPEPVGPPANVDDLVHRRKPSAYRNGFKIPE